MANRTNQGFLTCSNICWLIAILFGILVAYLLRSYVGMPLIVALLTGLIAVLGAGWLLTSYFCTDDASVSGTESAPDAGGFPASEAQVAAEPIATQAAPIADIPAAQGNITSGVDLPAGMAAASEGKPALYTSAPSAVDDLKRIKGVGPKLEKTLNGLGIYTFAQITEWTPTDIAWVDGNLTFKGRIERDDWVSQAKTLATGGETAFSQKVDKGDVY